MNLFKKDITYTFHYPDTNSLSSISIKKENLIKPEDIEKHIGELLIFHNGSGAVVSGVLKTAKLNDADKKYAFKHADVIFYTHELYMDAYYCDDDFSNLETYESAYYLKVQDITIDECMHGIIYIAKPTKEQLEFRKNILSLSNDEITTKYKYYYERV